MLQFLADHFFPQNTGEWVALVAILAIFGGGLIAAIVAFANGFKQKAGRVSLTKRGAVTLAFLVGVILVTLTACSDTAVAQKPVDAGGIGSDSKATAATATLNGKEYTEEAFVTNIDNEGIVSWAESFYSLSRQQIFGAYNGKCHPSNYDKRVDAVIQAMKRYRDPNAKGLKNPVSFPLYDLLEQVYNGNWSTLSVEEKLAIAEEGWKEYDRESLGNPEQVDEELQFLQDFPLIVERNGSWLPEFIQWFNDKYNATEEPVGNAACFSNTNNEAWVYDEYFITNALRVKKLFHDSFQLLEDPIQEWPTYKNWYLPLPRNNDADTNRTTPNPNQVWVPALILVDKYQEVGEGITGGICIFDQRLEEFKDVQAKLVKKETPPQQDKGNPTPVPNTPDNPATPDNPKPTPTPTPTPVPDTPSNPKNPAKSSRPNSKTGGWLEKDAPPSEYQDKKPTELGYADQGSKDDPSTWEDTSVFNPKQQETSSTPIKSTDKKESSGGGGQDHNITDPNGGKTTGGTAPNKNVLTPQTGHSATQTTTTTNSSGGATSTTTTTQLDRDFKQGMVSDD